MKVKELQKLINTELVNTDALPNLNTLDALILRDHVRTLIPKTHRIKRVSRAQEAPETSTTFLIVHIYRQEVMLSYSDTLKAVFISVNGIVLFKFSIRRRRKKRQSKAARTRAGNLASVDHARKAILHYYQVEDFNHGQFVDFINSTFLNLEKAIK